jgi:hypothetical protein
MDMMWLEYGDEWIENPDLRDTWGITPAFKKLFEQGYQV